MMADVHAHGLARRPGPAEARARRRRRPLQRRADRRSIRRSSAAPTLPHPPPGPDEHQITPLNQAWDILAAAPPPAAGWRGRLAGVHLARRRAGRSAAQQRFNSALVDHVNRSVPRERAVHRRHRRRDRAGRAAHIEESIRFQSQLVVYLQTLTPFVDTKDYEFAGLARRGDRGRGRSPPARLDEIARGLGGAAERAGRRAAQALRVADDPRPALGTGRSTSCARRWPSLQQTTAALQRRARTRPATRPRRPAAPRRRRAAPAVAAPPAARAQQMLRRRSGCAASSTPASRTRIRGSEDEIRERHGATTSRCSPARATCRRGLRTRRVPRAAA